MQLNLGSMPRETTACCNHWHLWYSPVFMVHRRTTFWHMLFSCSWGILRPELQKKNVHFEIERIRKIRYQSRINLLFTVSQVENFSVIDIEKMSISGKARCTYSFIVSFNWSNQACQSRHYMCKIDVLHELIEVWQTWKSLMAGGFIMVRM